MLKMYFGTCLPRYIVSGRYPKHLQNKFGLLKWDIGLKQNALSSGVKTPSTCSTMNVVITFQRAKEVRLHWTIFFLYVEGVTEAWETGIQ
jgi:hypothetical protein